MINELIVGDTAWYCKDIDKIIFDYVPKPPVLVKVLCLLSTEHCQVREVLSKLEKDIIPVYAPNKNDLFYSKEDALSLYKKNMQSLINSLDVYIGALKEELAVNLDG